MSARRRSKRNLDPLYRPSLWAAPEGGPHHGGGARSILEEGNRRVQLAKHRAALLIRRLTATVEELDREELELPRRYALADDVDAAWWAINDCPFDAGTRVAMEFLEAVQAASEFQARRETARALARRAPPQWVYVVVNDPQEEGADVGATEGSASRTSLQRVPTPPYAIGDTEMPTCSRLDEMDKEALRSAPPELVIELETALQEDPSLREEWMAYADYEPIVDAQLQFSATHPRLAATIDDAQWLAALAAWRRSQRSKRDGVDKWQALATVLINIGAWAGSAEEKTNGSVIHLHKQWRQWCSWKKGVGTTPPELAGG
jgi:hypothetical protein